MSSLNSSGSRTIEGGDGEGGDGEGGDGEGVNRS